MGKLIGYQIVSADGKHNIPSDFHSFEVLTTLDLAVSWLKSDKKNPEDKSIEWTLVPIYEGDVEEPTMIDSISLSNKPNKRDEVKYLAFDMLERSIPEIKKAIEKYINSGGIDVDDWDQNNNPMIMPKTILIAALEREADQYKGNGTSFEKQMKKDVKNLKYFY